MRVPDDVRDSVAFVCVVDEKGVHPIGTAFFIGVPVPGSAEMHVFFTVTARHVLAEAERIGHTSVHLRLNLKPDASQHPMQLVEVPIRLWLHHPEGTDVALLPWAPVKDETVDYKWFPFVDEGIAIEETIERHGIGIGDEVFIVGLFTRYYGRKRNEPIVRAGTIAAFPSDKIRTDYFGDINGDLVEVRSLGGLSGSPAYVHLGPRGGRVNSYIFLGLVHGHWNTQMDRIDSVAENGPNERIGTGIAVVIPATDVRGILSHPSVLDFMDKAQHLVARDDVGDDVPAEIQFKPED